MILTSRKVLLRVGVVLDLAVCAASLLYVSEWFTGHLGDIDAMLELHPFRKAMLMVALVLLWHLALRWAGLYRSYRTQGRWSKLAAIARGSVLATGLSAVWLLAFNLGALIAPATLLRELLLVWTASSAGLVASRGLAHILTSYLRKRGRNLRNLLVVGTNSRAVAVAQALTKDKNFGYHLVGFVDDHWHEVSAPDAYKSMLLGSTENILQLLRDLEIDEVVISLPIASYYRETELITLLCKQQGIPVRCEGSLFDTVMGTSASPSLITLYRGSDGLSDSMAKRITDLVFSSVALVVLSPLLAAIAIAVRASSPGPALFTQERLGRGKRRFRIYKFRTMVIDAEAKMKEVEHLNQSAGPTFKLKHDPRITPLGGFLRKTSLDELPQLLNVFLGDMSMVGPRPLPTRDYKGFSEDWHRRRFSVKPGITCLWQVAGRSSITFERWMELDIRYIEQWTVWLDLKIIAHTIPKVVRGSGAM